MCVSLGWSGLCCDGLAQAMDDNKCVATSQTELKQVRADSKARHSSYLPSGCESEP